MGSFAWTAEIVKPACEATKVLSHRKQKARHLAGPAMLKCSTRHDRAPQLTDYAPRTVPLIATVTTPRIPLGTPSELPRRRTRPPAPPPLKTNRLEALLVDKRREPDGVVNSCRNDSRTSATRLSAATASRRGPDASDVRWRAITAQAPLHALAPGQPPERVVSVRSFAVVRPTRESVPCRSPRRRSSDLARVRWPRVRGVARPADLLRRHFERCVVTLPRAAEAACVHSE